MQHLPNTENHPATLDERLPTLRATLLAQRGFRLDQLAALRARPQSEPPDEVIDALTEAAETVLADIETALAQIERGDYGRCQQCRSGEIPVEWLAVLPTASLCPDCLQAQSNAAKAV
jgi:RNA polymerase-binding transcription factor DksA